MMPTLPTHIILSSILFIITAFVHKHTYRVRPYEVKTEERVKFPLWLAAVMIVVAFTPIVNVIAFAIGVMAYVMDYNDIYNGIQFHCKAKWWRAIVNLLTKEV